MSEPLFKQISIVGVGLLGGSLGQAAIARKLASEIVGIGRTSTSLQEALRQEAITRGTTDMTDGLKDADLVVLCTPVRHIAEILPQVVEAVKPGTIITDVGSTKSNIVARGDEVTRDTKRYFVGSHPMAGSEKSGVRYSRPNLFEDSTCFVTRSPHTDLAAYAKICRFWRALGARLVVSRPDRHDRLTAIISHVPHLAAVALVRAVESFNEDRNLIRGVIGNGFRDATRIAAGNSEMWEDICIDNFDHIVRVREALARAMDELMAACSVTGQTDQLREVLDRARDYREFLDILKE